MKKISYRKSPHSILKSSQEGSCYKVLQVLDITSECKKETPGNVFLVYLKDKEKRIWVEIIDGDKSGALHLFYPINSLKSQVDNQGSCFPGWAKDFGLTSRKLYRIISTNTPA